MAPTLNLFDPATLAAGHPHAEYDRLRSMAPAWRHPASPVQPPFLALLTHNLIETVSRDGAHFTSTRGFRLATDRRVAIPGHVTRLLGRTVIALDPPEQQALRAVINPSFTPAALKALEARLRDWITDLVAGLEGDEEIDFVTRIAAVIPIKAICLVLGLPPEDDERVFRWTNAVLGSDDPAYAPTVAATTAAYEEMFAYADWLAARRRADPRADIVSALVAPRDDGSTLDDDTIRAMVSILITAGNETTRNSLTGSVMALHAWPDERRSLAAGDVALPRAVNELLRYVTPVYQMMRTATAPVEVGGESLAAGDRVVMLYGAGNHDPAVFDEPHALHLDRRNANRLLSFGVGAHHCAGARMALMQLHPLLAKLLERFPAYEITAEPDFLAGNLVWGVKSLRIRLGDRRS